MIHTPLRLDVLLTESALADRLWQSLDQRVLPEMFFYWFPLSVRTWLALCTDGKYRNYARSDTLLQAHATELVAHLVGDQIDVISLGSGQGTKDLHVLKALLSNGRQGMYRPVDSGQMLLEMACKQAIQHGVAAQGLKADITDPAHLSALQPGPHTCPRLVMMVGNTLGAFDPVVMLRRLRSVVREDDILIIDGELGHDDATRAGYEHPSNRAFALAPLRSIGLTETDGRLMFHLSNDVMPGMHRLEKSFRLHDDRTLHVGGEQLHFKAGDCIHMNHSGKFERSRFLSLLTQAEFEVIEEYLSEDCRFLMVAARPAP
ncbi:L-histidine N(alpha)-methyltransferase [Nitrospira sp. Nam74]